MLDGRFLVQPFVLTAERWRYALWVNLLNMFPASSHCLRHQIINILCIS